MLKITELLNFPDGTPVDAVQGRITAVYPARSVTNAKGTSTVQNAELSDVGGNKIKLTVWDHPDLGPLKDNEYVLHNTGGTRFPGIKLKHGSYVSKKDGSTVNTKELNVTKNGCFQHVEVYNQSKPDDKPAAEPVSRPKDAVTMADPRPAPTQGYINGASVGMAVNNAVEILKHQGPINMGSFSKDLYSIASDILRVSQHMEKGNLNERPEKTVGPGTTPTKPAPAKGVREYAPEGDVAGEDGIPF